VSAHLFPDNTVLCNFAAVHQLELLAVLLDGRGRWTEAVAHECALSSSYYTDLASVGSDGWLGEPIEINGEVEVLQVEGIRKAVFGGTSAKPTQHLGEAQTIHILTRWPNFKDSTWISDDRESLRVARNQGIAVRETQHLVAEAIQWGYIASAEAGFAMLQQMIGEGQSPAVPHRATDLFELA
jgi:predicted nucleic acid-binding protein